MSHSLILGVTGSGKTTLAKHIAKRLKRVIVFATYKSDWQCFHFTDNVSELVSIVETNKRLNIFIDEAGESLKRNDKEFQFLATRTRHFGHNVFFITQRANQLTPNIRTNCESLYCFKQSFNDASVLAQEFADETIMKVTELPKFYFYEKPFGCQVGKFKKVEKYF